MANFVTSNKKEQTLVSLFRDKLDAERAYDVVMDMGYSSDETNVVMSEETRDRHFMIDVSANTRIRDRELEVVGVSSAIGSMVGGLVGALAAMGILIPLPGLGLVVAGPLAAGLLGAGAGGVTGGLIGALLASGMPETSAKKFEEGIRQGGIMISITPRTAADAAQIKSEWQQLGGELLIH
jgi:hypothetical protein